MRIADSHFDRVQARNGLAAKNASQMSKIIPMLQVGSKKGPNEEEVIAKYETRIQELKRLAAEFEVQTQKLWTMHKVDRLRQMKRLTDAIEWLVAVKASKPPQGLASVVRKAMNTLVSLREFTYVDGESLTEEVIDLRAIRELGLQFAKLVSKTEQDLRQTQSGEETVLDPMFAPNVADVIASVQQATELPELGDNKFIVARVPIIPVAKTLLTTEQLRKWGFNVVSLGSYPVLQNQLVIGCKGSHADADEYRKQMRKMTKQKLAFVDTKSQGANGVHWFWLMLESELMDFANAFPGRSLQLRSWGFAIRK